MPSRERNAMDLDELVRQLTEVQSQLAFQEDTVAALNDALASQQREILVLRRQLALVTQRQDEQAAQFESLAPAPGHEKPPHY